MTKPHQTTDLPAADVGAILEALRAEVRVRRMARGVAAQGPHERDLWRALDELELHRVVSAHWPLTARTLRGRLLALCNKVVRRALRWYINPIVDQQNAYNDASARTLRLLADAYLDLAEQIAATKANEDGPTTDDRPPTTDHRSTGEQRPPITDHQPTGEQRTADGATSTVADGTTSTVMELMRLRAAAEPPARFPDLALIAQAPHLHERQEVSAHWSLMGRTPFDRAVALLQRVVRQYLRWLVNPIVEQQNAANGALTKALICLMELDSERRGEIARLRSRRR